jgi:drug/metabolite transporter (DMT)-like permease
MQEKRLLIGGDGVPVQVHLLSQASLGIHPLNHAPQTAIRAYGLLTLTALLWAGNAIAGKLAVGEVSPFLLTALRWAIAAALLGLLARRRIVADLPAIAANLPYLAAMGAVGFALFNVMFYLALVHTSAINVAIEQASMPLAVFALNFAFYGIRASFLQMAGFAITVIGVAITAAGGNPLRILDAGLNFGDLLMIMAISLYGGYSVALARKPAMHWLSFLAALAAFATLASLPFAAWEYFDGSMIWPTAKGWAVTVFTAVGPAIVAQLSWAMGLEIIGSNRGGVFINIVPAFAALFAVFLLGETFGAHHALAMALVIGGVWLSQRRAA